MLGGGTTLFDSMAELDTLFRSALLCYPEPFFILDAGKHFVFCNEAFARFAGFENRQEGPPATESFWPGVHHLDLDGQEVLAEFRLASGTQESVTLRLIELPDGYRLARVVTEPGVTTQGQFHAQRLRTLGMLAGGVAHDFNNVLAGILGHITYLKTILPETGPHVESLNAIEEGGKKASVMTQQILNFSKLETAEKHVRINLSELVVKTFGLLRGALSPEFNLHYRIPERPLFVMGVEGQMAQVIVNLVINSRDALEHGGEVSIVLERCADTGAEDSSNTARLQTLLPHGHTLTNYAVVKVVDNGMGMTAEVLRHVFEPYFSTKKNKGTGLGLSTVLTIVKSCGGVIDIQSQPNSGTEVAIYLPLIEHAEELKPANKPRVPLMGGTERVLIVDDEDPVRNVLCVSLTHLGYEVEVASSGAEALDKLVQSDDGFDLVILDMLMPKLPGDEVFFRLREIVPDLKVLVISGYTSEEAVQRILDHGGKGFIQKPFTIEELSKKVRACLDQ